MTVLVDLGNQRLKCARSDGGRPAAAEVCALPADRAAGFDEARAWLHERVGGETVWASSTHPAAWEALAAGAPWRECTLVAAPDWPLPVRSSGTGSDRVLAAYAAWLRCRQGLVVADCGTAWTLDVVSPHGEFLGGAIGPGLAVAQRALAEAAPHLAAPSERPGDSPPSDTEAAVAAGTYGALAAAVEAYAARFTEGFDPAPRLFLTGGDHERLLPWLTRSWEPAADLVLEGLAAVAAAPACP